MAVDSSGNAYVTGSTTGSFPTTTGAFRTTAPGGGSDAYVSKLNSTGMALVYSTYLGGSTGIEEGHSIAVNAAGYAFVTGETFSSNYPTTTTAYQSSYSGVGADAFVTKLNPAGSSLAFSTYFGGNCYEYGWGIAIDNSGSAYVVGYADSTNFPTTPGSIQPNYSGGYKDAFVARFALNYLSFTTQPGGAVAGQAFTTQPVVAVKNLDGTTATEYNGPISLTIKFGTGAVGAVLGGTTTVNAVNGIASFSGLSIDKVGTGYTLLARAGSLDPVPSAPFNVTLGGPASISVRGGSGQSTLINTAFTNRLQVIVKDSGGNPVNGVSVTFSAPTSQASGSFAGGGSSTTTALTDLNGVAIAPVLTANSTAGSYNVTASVSGVSPSASFNLTNTVLANGRVNLHLDPMVTGPNPISSTQILTATLKNRDGLPLSGVNVQFVISGANSQTSPNIQTNASGYAQFNYTGTVTGTDTITATATQLSGLQFKSNSAVIYWANSINPVSAYLKRPEALKVMMAQAK